MCGVGLGNLVYPLMGVAIAVLPVTIVVGLGYGVSVLVSAGVRSTHNVHNDIKKKLIAHGFILFFYSFLIHSRDK